MSGMYTSGLIGLTEENVGIDRRFYTNSTDTNPTRAVSYNNGRVDVYLNGVKLVGNHAGNSNHDYTMDSVTGTGTAITLVTGVALVASDVLELVGYVSNSSNTVQTYNFNVTTNTTAFTASHTASSLVNVYLNGVLLDSSDYTLNGSNTVTLGSNAVNGDVVAIQVIGALDYSNFVPAGGGTFSGNVSFGDNNITNVGDIAVDTISSDAGTSIGVTLGTDAGDDFNVGSNKLVVEGDTGNVGIGNDDPANTLSVHSTGQTIVRVDGANQYYTGVKIRNNHSSTQTDWNIGSAGGNSGWGSTNGNFLIRDDTTNSTGLEIEQGAGSNTPAVKINSAGSIVIGTAGQGIDFSAQTPTGVTGASVDSGGEVLDHYEEGVWEFQLQGGLVNSAAKMGRYTKIGNLVTITGQFQQGQNQDGGDLKGLNIPFALKADPTNGNGMCVAGVRMYNQDLLASGATYVTLDAGQKLEFWEHYDNNASSRVQRDDGAYIAFTLTYQTA